MFTSRGSIARPFWHTRDVPDNASNQIPARGAFSMVDAPSSVKLQAMLIDGQPAFAQDGGVIRVDNPGRHGEALADVPRARAADVDIAVRSAEAAFRAWKQVSPK